MGATAVAAALAVLIVLATLPCASAAGGSAPGKQPAQDGGDALRMRTLRLALRNRRPTTGQYTANPSFAQIEEATGISRTNAARVLRTMPEFSGFQHVRPANRSAGSSATLAGAFLVISLPQPAAPADVIEIHSDSDDDEEQARTRARPGSNDDGEGQAPSRDRASSPAIGQDSAFNRYL